MIDDYNSEDTLEVSENSMLNIATDYQERFKFIILPPWIEDAIAKSTKQRSICTDPEELSSILSRVDVQNYIRLSSSDVIAKTCFPKEYIHYLPLFNSNLVTKYVSGSTDEEIIERFLFNYFLDSEYVTDSLDSFYITIRPYFDNVIAIRLHRATAEDNVYKLQSEAFYDWITLARKYVSFESIAKSGILELYLKQHGKYLKSVNG